MQVENIVIVGGVAAGASAATRARRVNAKANIIMLEKGPAVSFANCGLPYHIGGEIAERDHLLVATPELFKKRFNIDVRLNTEAVEIDRDKQQVIVRLPSGDKQAIPYDRLVLAPGAAPFVPPPFDKGSSGERLRNVATLWTLPDMDSILSALSETNSHKPSALVVGGGFVGLEVAEQLAHRGVDCTLIEKGDQILRTLDQEMVRPLEDTLRNNGVNLRFGVAVERIVEEAGFAKAVQFNDGSELKVDVIVVAIGVRPRISLAQAAGLNIGKAGGIEVNEWMQTSDQNIFAAGDCIEYQHRILDRPTLMPLGGPANRSGRVAGTMAGGGKCAPMAPVLGTSVIRIFNYTAASSGLTAARCKLENIDFRTVYVQSPQHASYFPGSEPMTIKLVYTPDDGRILGVQAIGGEGVDKRIDVIATVMQLGGTVYDLAGLDLAYAPPYGSAKDAVHMAAFAACNDLMEYPSVIHPETDLSEFQVIDVRSDAEIQRLPLAGAIPINVDTLYARDSQPLDPSLPTVVVCHTGKRAHVAACYLKSQGFRQVSNLTGGMAVRKNTNATSQK